MVSIIVPVFQVSGYVERCIRSVMAQSYGNIECIIVDDASMDDSIAKCEELIRNYEGPITFRMIHHENNRGLSASRNTGTSAAKGDYVYYLDSDDYITPDCIESLVKAVLDDPAIEMVQGNSMMTSDGTEKTLYRLDHPTIISDNDEARKEFFKNRNIYISVWNRLLKKSFIDEYKLYCREGILFEDLLWVFDLLKHLNKAYMSENVTHYYCIRPGSISTVADPKAVGCYPVMFDEIMNNLTPGHERSEIEGYLYYFIKRYISYIRIAPAFKNTIRLYRIRARQFNCWYVYTVLSAVSVFGRYFNPSGLLEWLNRIRWRFNS